MEGKRLAGLLAAGLALAAAGCTNEDTAKLSRVGRLLGKKLESAAGGDQAVKLPALPQPSGLEGRVRQRLRDDKLLAVQAIEVRADGGRVELTGRVQDLAQRRRAVELAESTAGVEGVVDRLEESGPGR
jgi:hypothetical protein